MKRGHIHELNVTRALAIIAVLLIHSTSSTVTNLDSDSNFFLFYVVLNIASKFAVPAFIFLSGLVLFYNYMNKAMTKETILTFYRKRLAQIAVPYLFFSVFYYMITSYMISGSAKTAIMSIFTIEFLNRLLIGKAYTHLYFIFIMIQFYIMLPFILILLKKVPRLSRHLIWIGFVIQWIFIYVNATYWQYPYKGSISLSYMFFFLTGAFIGIYYEKCIQFLKLTKQSIHMWVIGLWGLWIAATAYNIYLYYYVFADQIYLTNSKIYELVWEIQSITASIILLQVSYWIYHTWNKRMVHSLDMLGILSFGVFLFHPFLLLIYRKIDVGGNILMFHVWSLGGFVFSLVVSWIVVYIAGRYFKYHWIAFGPIPVKPKK
ncbi:acyltransferase [Cytobacillus sp. FJAT-53684]|uniref:Acyltransferase n=1 Tax=Cytobacillus mangrovibacter TaxID=3299024 RepID=A0ABW6JX81_9BACI